MTKTDRTPADLKLVEPPRAERAVERMPSVANPGDANIVYFDAALAWNYGNGVGSIVVTATRQLVDTAGQPYEDRIVTGILKAPLQTLQQLRAAIDSIERRAHDEVAAAVAATQAEPGVVKH